MSKYKKVIIAIVIAFFLVPTLMFSGSRYFLNRGVELMDESPEEARNHFRTAADINPLSGKGHAYKALSYHDGATLSSFIHREEVENVIENYEKAASRLFTEAWAYQNLGFIYYQRSRQLSDKKKYAEKSINNLEKANSMEKSAKNYHYIGNLNLYIYDDVESAESYFKQGVENFPQDVSNFIGLVSAYVKDGDCEDAKRYFETAMDFNKERMERSEYDSFVADGYFKIGLCHVEGNNIYVRGLDYFLKAYEADSEHLGSLLYLVKTYNFLGAEETANWYEERLSNLDV